MQPSFEKLIPPTGSSIRCFDRSIIEKPAGWHYHPEVEICLIERGSGTRFVGDHIGNYGDGDLVLLGANLPHHWASDEFRGHRYDRHPAVVVQFDPVQFGGQFFGLPEMADTVELLDRAGRGLHVRGKTRVEVAAAVRAMLQQHPAARLLSLLSILHQLAHSTDLTPLASPGLPPHFGRGCKIVSIGSANISTTTWRNQSSIRAIWQNWRGCIPRPSAGFSKMVPSGRLLITSTNFASGSRRGCCSRPS